MNKLDASERELIGRWIPSTGGLQADDTAKRIEWLTAEILEKVADSPRWGAWETLFRDPADGRLWERSYPQGEMEGGGPPRIATIPADEARTKYRLP